MPNIHDCLDLAVQGGGLSRSHADQAKVEYDQLVARYETVMPRHQAEVTARANLKEATSRARRSRRHMVLNQLQTLQRIKSLLGDMNDPSKAVLDMFETTPGSAYKGQNFEFSWRSIRARIRHDLREALEEVGTNVFTSSKNPAMLSDIMRELHGQSTGSVNAKAYSDAITGVQGWLRQMYNAHGGDIGELANYGTRHTHDGRAIEAAGFDTWRGEIFDKLDWSRIVDLGTGKPFVVAKGARPMQAEADAFLKRIYDNIVTGGWNTREAGLTQGGKALYKKHDDARVLHFKDGDTWMAYNKVYGDGDPLTAIVSSLDQMGREIALMKVFGPNPNAGLEFAIQTTQKRAATSGNPKLRKRVEASAKHARVLMHHATGLNNQAVHEGWAKGFSTSRHLLVATRLGSAIWSSVTDLATITSGSVAMGRNPANILTHAVKMMSSTASVKSAARAGFALETLMSVGTSSARMTNDVVANDIASRMSGFVIRAQGLAAWTDRMRLAVQMDTAGHLADNVGRSFADVDPMLRNLMERNGITARDWEALSEPGALFKQGDADFVAPYWWLEHQSTLPRAEAEGLAIRLQAALEDQQELFVPSKRLRSTGAVMGDTRPGTVIGELARSSVGFKNYVLSLTMGQIHLFNSLPSPQAKAGYLATMLSSTLILGALAIQLKEMVKARDPRPMDSNAFWLAAMLQGGGLGIFGDFFFSEQNRFGGGLATTIAGPLVGTVADFANFGASNIKLAADGKETKFGGDGADLVRRNTPVLSSFWPTRVAYDRLVADRLQMMLDPDAEARMRRAEKSQERTFGNASWWQRGQTAPSRAPDFSNILGDR